MAYLSVFVQHVSEEPVGVRESLRAGAFSNAHHAVLLRVQDTTLGLEHHKNVNLGKYYASIFA